MDPKDIIEVEAKWRALSQAAAMAVSAPSVVATRWHAGSQRTLEFAAETSAECHVVKIVLRTMNIRFSVSGRTVQDGVTTA